ncbi:NAD-dependent epimerase/dehydratase family protein [Idiomarina sp. A28L]|uniref:NAD-dependent epimerase/dehydratase family protein n=1 Tax=Idiomarina sp. A28L TaxID=1036674 RepID=UPI0013029961|nr:NAD-dependent epimerase/dehydratase family protein [Idiomarina sp. A28L]
MNNLRAEISRPLLYEVKNDMHDALEKEGEHEHGPHCGHEHGEISDGDEQPKALLIGYGDIGSRLAPMLVEIGFAVTGVRRNANSASEIEGVVVQAGDVSHADTWAKLMQEQWDLIVVTLTPSEYSTEGYHQGYVVPMQQLVQHLPAESDTLILYVSSTSVYGQREGEWVDESLPAEPSSASGEQLLAAENTLRAGLAGKKAHLAIVRAAGIYGPGRERMYRAISEGTYTITPVWHNRIHADDLAGALEHLALQHFMGATLEEVYIACEDEPLFGEDYVRRIAAQIGLDPATVVAKLPRSNEVGPRGSKRLSNMRLRKSGWQLLGDE